MKRFSTYFNQNESRFSVAVLTAVIIVMIQGCAKNIEIPAQTLVGEWTNRTAFYLYDASDSCTGTYASYDSSRVNMKWAIAYFKDNLVNITVTGTSDTTIFSDSLCHMNRQYRFPMQLRGIVGSNQLVVERSYSYYDSAKESSQVAFVKIGDFLFTSSTITGTLSDQDCDTVHCFGYQSRKNAIALRK